MGELRNTITEKYEVETKRTILNLQQNIEQFRNENDQLKNMIGNYQQ